MLLRQFIMLTAFAGLAHCGTIPDVGGTSADAARAADFPELVAIDSLIERSETIAPQITPASIAITNDRIAQLRNRAGALRRPVVDQATRARMRAAIARAALR
ncbi:hypothetical protein MWU61_10865 [Loktanella sp. F6476L]|uniref:hypothetical protein n=1 Tax=Loktanella sp. F6476L TaxID=2926405 RepID=UPI001FF0EBB0|nr:hypothetical protein [Loktanella sp. F6476L]MCK0121045.1 hypothetical protein [Loktanella sp. F6476L]